MEFKPRNKLLTDTALAWPPNGKDKDQYEIRLNE